MRRLVIAVIVLVVILVAADRVALKVAEGQVATQLQSAENLPATPDVDIHGFPFLTQVLKGRYTGVDASVHDLDVEQGVEIDRVKVRLDGVHVPLSALLHGDLGTIPVDAAAVTGVASYANLDQAAASRFRDSGLEVHFGPGKRSGDLALTGTYATGAIRVKLTGEASVQAQNGELLVSIPQDALDVPAAIRGQLVRLLGTSYRLPPLPLNLKVSQVKVGSSGVSVTATGSQLTLGSNR